MGSEPKSGRWERRPEERPQEILEAALSVFRECGYRGTRLDEVAERAGVSKPTLYHYFPGKDELLAQAVVQRVRQSVARLEGLAAGDGTASERLGQVLRQVWRTYVVPEVCQGFRLALGELASEAPEVFRLWAEEGMLRRWRVVEELIVEGQTSGEFRADADAAVIARMVVSALTLQSVLRPTLEAAGLDALAEDRLYESTIEHLLHGLRPSTGGEAAPAGARR